MESFEIAPDIWAVPTMGIGYCVKCASPLVVEVKALTKHLTTHDILPPEHVGAIAARLIEAVPMPVASGKILGVLKAIPIPATPLSALPFLPIGRDGLACAFCPYVAKRVLQVVNHHKDTHPNEPDATYKRNIPFQSIGWARKRRLWQVVIPPEQAGVPVLAPALITRLDDKQLVQDRAAVKLAATATTASHKEINYSMGPHRHFEGRNLSAIRRLSQDPVDKNIQAVCLAGPGPAMDDSRLYTARMLNNIGLHPRQLDALNVMSTTDDVVYVAGSAAGKTMAILLPACAAPNGVSIIISRLASLQQQLLKQALDQGINAVIWAGDADMPEATLVIVMPEAMLDLAWQQFSERLVGQHRLDRVVIDEAHVVLDMTDNFRRQFPELGSYTRMLSARRLFITDTLAPSDMAAFEQIWKISPERHAYLRVPTVRRNLSFGHIGAIGEDQENIVVASLLQQMPSSSDKALIFCRTKRRAEKLATVVRTPHCYHDDMDNADKTQRLMDWGTSGGVMVATTALDEGLDVFVGLVIAVGDPHSLRDFSQQAALAGCVEDSVGHAYLVSHPVAHGHVAELFVRADCRRQALSAHLDGLLHDRCGRDAAMCDLCAAAMRRRTQPPANAAAAVHRSVFRTAPQQPMAIAPPKWSSKPAFRVTSAATRSSDAPLPLAATADSPVARASLPVAHAASLSFQALPFAKEWFRPAVATNADVERSTDSCQGARINWSAEAWTCIPERSDLLPAQSKNSSPLDADAELLGPSAQPPPHPHRLLAIQAAAADTASASRPAVRDTAGLEATAECIIGQNDGGTQEPTTFTDGAVSQKVALDYLLQLLEDLNATQSCGACLLTGRDYKHWANECGNYEYSCMIESLARNERAKYSACPKCLLPQKWCDMWQPDGTGSYYTRSLGQCRFGRLFIELVAALSLYRSDHLCRGMRAAGAGPDELPPPEEQCSSLDQPLGPRRSERWLCARLDVQGDFHTTRLVAAVAFALHDMQLLV